MSKLSKILHGVGHVVWLGAQYANVASGLIPTPYQPLVAAGLALVQAAHAFYVGRQSASQK